MRKGVERVRRGERVAWLALVLLAHQGREIGKSEAVRLLSEKLQLSERQVRNLITLLLDKGYLEPVARGWEVWGLRVTPAGEELVLRLFGHKLVPQGERA